MGSTMNILNTNEINLVSGASFITSEIVTIASMHGANFAMKFGVGTATTHGLVVVAKTTLPFTGMIVPVAAVCGFMASLHAVNTYTKGDFLQNNTSSDKINTN